MKKSFLSFICLMLMGAVQLHAYEERNLLQQVADLAKIKESLVMNQAWVPFPDYIDRAGWDQLFGEFKTATKPPTIWNTNVPETVRSWRSPIMRTDKH